MQGDALHAQQGLTWRRRVQALNRNAVRAQSVRDQIAGELDERRREIATLSDRVERLTKVGELLRVLMDKLVLDQVKTIENVVTEGLQAIFFDQRLKFEVEVSQKYNKIAIDFFFRQGDESMAIRGHPLKSFGGGPSSTASLILRLLSIIRLKRTPILFLDETLGAINGDEYIDAAGQFLNKLAASTGIDILYVSQKQSFMDHAAVAYQAESNLNEDGSWRLSLHHLRGAR